MLNQLIFFGCPSLQYFFLAAIGVFQHLTDVPYISICTYNLQYFLFDCVNPHRQAIFLVDYLIHLLLQFVLRRLVQKRVCVYLMLVRI